MKVLFCTDGSQISFNAIKNFTQYCNKFVVDIICVIDWAFYPMYMDNPIQNYQSTYEEIANNFIDLAQKYIEESGNLVDKRIIVFGNIAEEILRQTKKCEYSLVILGSNGKKGIHSWLGSVSREVINTIKNNVFVAKNISQNKNILFAIDGSEYSFYVIQKTLDLINLSDCAIYTIYVQKDLNNIPIELKLNKAYLNQIIKQQQEDYEKTTQKVRNIFKRKDLLIKRETTVIGEATQKILEFNKEINFDLIVMGSHTKNALQRLILGSTSMRILERAQNSVLLIFPKTKSN